MVIEGERDCLLLHASCVELLCCWYCLLMAGRALKVTIATTDSSNAGVPPVPLLLGTIEQLAQEVLCLARFLIFFVFSLLS